MSRRSTQVALAAALVLLMPGGAAAQRDPAALDLLDFTPDDGPVFGRDPRAEGVELVQRVADQAP